MALIFLFLLVVQILLKFYGNIKNPKHNTSRNREMGEKKHLPLFETRPVKGRFFYWIYAVSMVVGISCVIIHRILHAPRPGEDGRLAWTALFASELWFSLYWLFLQSVRFNPIRRYTFKDRLSDRYEKVLPGVDIFVCTADVTIEPPAMVISTVLSLMAYNYPPEKLSVYLSDDGGSELMFYALLEASSFAKHWLPFCRRFKIEPRSPAAYFSIVSEAPHDDSIAKDWSSVKKLYEEMKERIDQAVKSGKVSEETRKTNRGFQEWDLVSDKRDHQAIIEILINATELSAVDIEGQPLPTLVYLAREKRPQCHHNFKAGAMNALIRVSSRISNSPIILNVDCDMYSNNADSIRDALCFFMDEESDRIAYVQYPQGSDNLTKNDLYGNSLRVIYEVEKQGLDSNGGPLYIGSGCFHRRQTLCGKSYEKGSRTDWYKGSHKNMKQGVDELGESCKVLASCSYEQNTQWGKEMGLKYGYPVEDVITGLSIQCRGWRSVYFNPERKGFLGIAPTTLLQTLVQHKRWSEGDFQIFISKYCPLTYGHKRIPVMLQVSYCCYLLWAPNSLPTLCYVYVPSFYLLRGTSLFPELSSYWFLPYSYVIIAASTYSLFEFLWSRGTLKGWWNDQRIWMYKRLTSYLFGVIDTVLKLLGIAKSGFAITAKTVEDDVSSRYEKEIMEFGATSPMFNILSTIAILNLFCLLAGTKRIIADRNTEFANRFAVQIILCSMLVLINLPLYEGLFFRKDKGRMPSSVAYQSIALALFSYLLVLI